MNARRLAILTLVALVAPLALGQTITLNDFLTLVRTKHPFFEKERMAAEIERTQQNRFLGEQDWIVRSSFFSTRQEPIATSTFSPERIYNVGVGSGLERAFWNSGGRLSLSWSSDFIDQSIPDIVIPGFVTIPAGPSQLYQNRIFVTYSLPLMQNFGGKLDRLNYELGDYTVDFTELQAVENQEGFLLDLATRFLDWVLLSEIG